MWKLQNLTYSMVQSPSWEANWFAASRVNIGNLFAGLKNYDGSVDVLMWATEGITGCQNSSKDKLL